MLTLIEQFHHAMTSAEVSTVNALCKLVVSALLGGAIGVERKRKGQIAGSRTFALISMGATLAMIVSCAIPQLFSNLTNNGDPARIAAQVISGIGFLGAGAIIQTKASVRGLTTAAGIWVSAGLGLAVGIGLYTIAFVALILILITLVVINRIESKLLIGWDNHIINIRIHSIIDTVEPYRILFKEHDVKLHEWYLDVDYSTSSTTINFLIKMRENTDTLKLFNAMSLINPTDSITLKNEM